MEYLNSNLNAGLTSSPSPTYGVGSPVPQQQAPSHGQMIAQLQELIQQAFSRIETLEKAYVDLHNRVG